MIMQGWKAELQEWLHSQIFGNWLFDPAQLPTPAQLSIFEDWEPENGTEALQKKKPIGDSQALVSSW